MESEETKKEKEIIADLHIHSRFSRATSKNIDISNLVRYAKIKGVNLLGTGDFQHPFWFKELQELEEKDGILYYQDFPFLWQTEVSLMYSQGGKGRRVHYVILAPNIDVVKQIINFLGSKGRLDYDGRPIFGFSSILLAEEMERISDEIEIIPAHCILGDEIIHTNYSIKAIKNIQEGDLVYTYNNNWKKVKKVLIRAYKGKMYKIVPWYFIEGLSTTPEHPFYAIKSYKNCSWTKGICKKGCSQEKNCKKKPFLSYKKEWIQAKDLEKSDFLIYPRFNQEKDLNSIKLTEIIKGYRTLNKDFLLAENSRNNRGVIKNDIVVDREFCRLIGYFLSEGYLIRDEAIGFSFNSKEKDYIEEVINSIKKIFGISKYKIDSRRENQADILFYSKILNIFFSQFYINNKKKAPNKLIPFWIVLLSKEKLAEVLRGWWRGDTGITVSRNLANQMKLICLKLGIIPSISIEPAEKFNARGKHFIGERKIIANNDLISFRNLSFFEKDYDMLEEKCFKKFINKIKRKHGFIDENYIYLPVKKIETKDYDGGVYNLEVEDDNSYVAEFACVHNCMTPWFGIFGSMSGFDSLQEAFQEKTDKIHAVESGMSADPEMLRKLSFLNDKSIVSFSDSHSFWPWRMGREATIFLGELTYRNILKQIRENSFKATIETDPAYGKYHYDGHRLCKFSCSPEESKKLNNTCPKCGRQLTIGVENRVEQLTTNPKGFIPKNAKPFYKLLPLHELIALAKASTLASKKTWQVYNKLIEKFQNELNVLLHVEKQELARVLPEDEQLVQLIIDNRIGNIKVKPGFDGEYGIPMLKERQERLF